MKLDPALKARITEAAVSTADLIVSPDDMIALVGALIKRDFAEGSSGRAPETVAQQLRTFLQSAVDEITGNPDRWLWDPKSPLAALWKEAQR